MAKTHTRWNAHRKAEVVRQILAAEITPQEAIAQHTALSLEELESWMNAYQRGGVRALGTRGLQQTRPLRVRDGGDEHAG